MFPVSTKYKEKIQELNRTFNIDIKIYHSTGILELTDEDLVEGSLDYSEGSQAGEEFTIGGTVASDIDFTILKKPEYETINFIGARVQVNVGLLVEEGVDGHFLQPSQPSQMLGFDDLWEYVPLGNFYIDEVDILRNTIVIKAIDNMIKLDVPYSVSKLSYPANLYQIYTNICSLANITVGTTDFPNKNYMVQTRPDGELSLRDILGYVAELSGTFAKCNKYGALELNWYKPTNVIIEPKNRFDLKLRDDLVQITGVMVETETQIYLTGTNKYVVNLTDNPLLQGNYSTVLPPILANIGSTIFTPYECNWQGNPALQSGDIIQQLDVDGNIHDTLITSMTYKYRGKSSMKASGLSELSRGFKGSTDKRISEIKKQIDVEVDSKLSDLEQAQLNATELIANMLGGYIIEDKSNGVFYIADNPDINLAQKVWKYGINGFGYSSTGVNGTYSTAVTADGSIVAMLVSANIVTADMVKTGVLTSENGNSWFNLDTGVLRISHGGTEYSQMDINGFKRQYSNGSSEYLNGIYVVEVPSQGNPSQSTPPPVRVQLPVSFRDRGHKTKIFVFQPNMSMPLTTTIVNGQIKRIMTNYSTRCEVVSTNFSAQNPYVDVLAYQQRADFDFETNQLDYVNSGIKFIVVVLGS